MSESSVRSDDDELRRRIDELAQRIEALEGRVVGNLRHRRMVDELVRGFASIVVGVLGDETDDEQDEQSSNAASEQPQSSGDGQHADSDSS